MPVLVRCRLRRARIVSSRIQRLAETILKAVGESTAELSLDVVGDGRMRRLNREFRRKDTPTDVLAFSMREAASPVSSLLGDVVISLPTAARQASARRHSLDVEIATLLIHGVLHLCGYDHERSDAEARRMRRKEQDILRALGRIPTLVKARNA